MEIINSKITKIELRKKYLDYFKTMVKAVIDIEKGLLAIDAELHSDLEELLLDKGSKQKNLWGINLYPMKDKKDFIEFTSLINIRPHQDNYSMEVKDKDIKKRIKAIVYKFISHGS